MPPLTRWVAGSRHRNLRTEDAIDETDDDEEEGGGGGDDLLLLLAEEHMMIDCDVDLVMTFIWKKASKSLLYIFFVQFDFHLTTG